MNINQLKESKYLKKEDCGATGIIVTIRDLEQVNVAMADDPEDMKWVINFEEDLKPLVLNSTNAQRIAAITGKQDTDDWGGVKVILYNDPTIMYAGKMVGGLRVRELKKKGAAPSTLKPKTTLPPEDPGHGPEPEPEEID